MKRLLLLICLLVLPSLSQAQVVNNPTSIGFNSADHTTVDGLNRNILTGYLVEFVQEGATAAFTSATVPRANVTVITPANGTTPALYGIPFSALPSYPFGVNYKARVTAIGVAGNSSAAVSVESFTRPVPVPAPVTGVVYR